MCNMLPVVSRQCCVNLPGVSLLWQPHWKLHTESLHSKGPLNVPFWIIWIRPLHHKCQIYDTELNLFATPYSHELFTMQSLHHNMHIGSAFREYSQPFAFFMSSKLTSVKKSENVRAPTLEIWCKDEGVQLPKDQIRHRFQSLEIM